MLLPPLVVEVTVLEAPVAEAEAPAVEVEVPALVASLVEESSPIVIVVDIVGFNDDGLFFGRYFS
jgi:hypothetical protein